jgi:hypothetical protein
MREDDLVRAIINALTRTGWRACHFRPAQTAGGWRTAVQGHTGFPDIIAVHPQRGVLVIECKSERGQLTDEQIARRQWFEAVEDRYPGAIEYRLVRPDDWQSGMLDNLLGVKHG